MQRKLAKGQRAEKKANEHFYLAQRMLRLERGGFHLKNTEQTPQNPSPFHSVDTL